MQYTCSFLLRNKSMWTQLAEVRLTVGLNAWFRRILYIGYVGIDQDFMRLSSNLHRKYRRRHHHNNHRHRRRRHIKLNSIIIVQKWTDSGGSYLSLITPYWPQNCINHFGYHSGRSRGGEPSPNPLKNTQKSKQKSTTTKEKKQLRFGKWNSLENNFLF